MIFLFLYLFIYYYFVKKKVQQDVIILIDVIIQLSRFRSVRKLWLVASSIYDILFVELEKEFCLYTKNSLFN